MENFMQLQYEIPDSFWSLFRSVNREVYIEALLCIHEEYQYSNYFLTKEVCIQILGDLNAKNRFQLLREENETDYDMLETTASRILRWLVKNGWLKKIEDYSEMTTNIVIPDYAAIFIEAFERLTSEELEETEIYIQNVYATLFSFKNDSRVNVNMLRTALINTRKLNKALQDMLHNMDKFFERLLNQESYEQLLKEHLDGYVEEVVKKKYHILKTSDNFYIYKMDIKKCLREMRENEEWLEASGDAKEDILELLDMIERGFDHIEYRIANIDREHSKYVRATVTRMNYLLSEESDTKGLIVQLLNKLSVQKNLQSMLEAVSRKMNLSCFEMLSEKSLYKRRKQRKDFIQEMGEEEEIQDLNREDVLKLNKIQMRYSRQEIEDFIESHIENDILDTERLHIGTESDFEKLILAYDYSMRRNSKYKVLSEEGKILQSGAYKYPSLKFVRRRSK